MTILSGEINDLPYVGGADQADHVGGGADHVTLLSGEVNDLPYLLF